MGNFRFKMCCICLRILYLSLHLIFVFASYICLCISYLSFNFCLYLSVLSIYILSNVCNIFAAILCGKPGRRPPFASGRSHIKLRRKEVSQVTIGPISFLHTKSKHHKGGKCENTSTQIQTHQMPDRSN